MFRNMSGAILLLVGIVTASTQLYEKSYVDSCYQFAQSSSCVGKICRNIEAALRYSELIKVAIVAVILAIIGYVLDLTQTNKPLFRFHVYSTAMVAIFQALMSLSTIVGLDN